MKFSRFADGSATDPKNSDLASGRRKVMVVEKQNNKNSCPIDEYTDEPEPEAVDAGKVIEVVPTDSGERAGEDFLLEEEDSLDKLALDEQADAMAKSANRYTKDERIAEDFEERQQLAYSGRDKMHADLEQHHALSPELSGEDVDAEWQDTNTGGEEVVGGTVATPDQDVVSEMGEILGIEYKDDEPLNTEEKLRKRDRKRWELNPKSSDEKG
jgi:hypothetical protein